MKNTQDITLMLLVVSAAVLTALLVGAFVYTQPAQAAGSSVKDGDYVMTVGSYDESIDFVYVIDIASNRLNLYFVNINTKAITQRDSMDLSRIFRHAN